MERVRSCACFRVYSCLRSSALRIFLPMHNYYYSLSMLVSWISILDICTSLSVCETYYYCVCLRCLHSLPVSTCYQLSKERTQSVSNPMNK